jgi:hypothetical protein
MVLNNLKSKYKDFYNTDSCNIESAVQLIILLKEVVIHIPIRGYTAKIPASFWRFHFNNLNDEHRNFLNVEEGARTVQLLMLANEVEIVQY